MTGAIVLSAKSCVAAGAGITTIATSERSADLVAGFDPEYMVLPLAGTSTEEFSEADAEKLCVNHTKFSVAAIGPGLGQSHSTERFVLRFFSEWQRPLVCDADALNALAISKADFPKFVGVRILTPHPGEFERLSGVSAKRRPEQMTAAEEYARKNKLILVLKGFQTLVTDGTDSWINETGNSGMAVGGMGDCLTGIITALLAQGLSPFAAAQLGVAVHGIAGDLAQKKFGGLSVSPLKLISMLPNAFDIFS